MNLIVLADFSLFIGRFHPLVVHLPIGLLLLAVVLEWWPGATSRSAIRAAWLLGAVSAVVAAGCGWLLAEESGGGDTLVWHRWLGVSVSVLAVLGVFITPRGGLAAKGYGLLVAGVLGLTGHLGGSLTHGEDYLLQHAPAVVQRLTGHAPDSSALVDWTKTDPDSINLYATFLQPAIEESCVRCHNDQQQKGGLRLDAPHLALAGGEDGPLLEPGEPLRSNWVKRVTLPRDHAKAMPPSGEPWSFTQIELLRYWIAQGADTAFVLDAEATPADLKILLQRDYGLDLRPRRFVEDVRVPELTEETKKRLSSLNWQLSLLQPDGGAVEAQPRPGERISPEALLQLAELASEQVVYLNLDRQALDDAALTPLNRFTNLNRLRLNGTDLTSAALERLIGLEHLESLNLYGTDLDAGIFEHLQHFPSLKRLYLWQTRVSPEAAATFASNHPRIAVETGFVVGEPGDNNLK